MQVVVVGPSRGLVEAFQDRAVELTHVEGVATRDVLEEAGTAEADTIVVTDVEEASAVPVARTLNEGLRIVFYDHRSLPDFVRGQVDLAVDPDLLDPDVVVEELDAA